MRFLKSFKTYQWKTMAKQAKFICLQNSVEAKKIIEINTNEKQ